MPKIYNALQLKNGAKVEHNRMGSYTQPIQFLRKVDKDDEWCAWNMDWFELQGLKQIKANARRLLKNYKLANGIIDKSDYIIEEDNEVSELIEVLTKEDESAFELKFFPIIPNIINILSNEFSKRSDKIVYRSLDTDSYNELLEEKRMMVEEVLVKDAEAKMETLIKQMGFDTETEEGKAQADQMRSPENIKSLPEIEDFFKKSYRSIVEQWAAHQHDADEERFALRELENIAFKDSLITDREFWHFKMNDDDYEIELWNPVFTFYHKSPEAKYVSQGNFVGKIDLLTISDVIDKYGYMMSAEQLEEMEKIFPVKSAGYLLNGIQNDGGFYDPTKSHQWNVEGPSLAMRQYHAFNDYILGAGDDIINRIFAETTDPTGFDNTDLLRVTTVYWKSQRMVGHLSSIGEDGILQQQIIDETFKLTTKPVYDTRVIKEKSKETLIYGQHVDWIWINQTYGGVKIGPNTTIFSGMNNTGNFEPIYLNVKPVKFQFKGDHTIYGCKLPVEGCVFSDRSTKSSSLVDKIKAPQIGFNLVNNQIADILIDELGTVVVLDQNALPKHSMGEDWGKGNYAKAYVAMKNFNILPLDTTMGNIDAPMNFQHYQSLDLSQTQRLLSRIQLAVYFKQQAYEMVGITPQRLGEVVSQETATGVTQALNASYAQTEHYFTQHSEYLMPRVHQMRTDLAQYYNSKKPSLRLQFITSKDENVNFQINGTKLLNKEIGVFASTKVNSKAIMEQIRTMALNNNTGGASIYDLGNIIKASSLGEITNVMKEMEMKAERARQEQLNVVKETEQIKQENENARLAAEQALERELAANENATDIEVAKIRAATLTGLKDSDTNGQNDYIDTLEYLDKKEAMNKSHELSKEKILHDQIDRQQKNDIAREALQSRERIADKQVKIAAINKNKYDKPSKK